MYCTLQEAYNIPSFVSKKKKGCMSPLANASKVDQSQSQPIGKISADSYDPYDPYTSSSGREQALSFNMNKTEQEYKEQTNIPNKPNIAQNAGLSNKNSPIWSASQGMIYNRSPENENFASKNNEVISKSSMNDIPYSSQVNDYKYYCDTYGICSKPTVEGFANPDMMQHVVPSSKRYPQVQQSNSIPNIMFSKNGPPNPDISGQVNTPYYGPNPMGKCSPLQAPAYELPLSDENRAQFNQAMEASLNQEQGATLSVPYPMRKVNMNSVAGYYDEELEQFLTTQSMKNEKLPEPLKETPVDISSPDLSKAKTPSNDNKTSFNYIQSPQYIMDLLLFIAAGILVILLCDQIFKLGMSFGMRDTVQILMPYLEDLKKSVD